MTKSLHSWEKGYIEFFLNSIYFISDSRPLFGKAKRFQLKNLSSDGRKLFYKDNEKKYEINYSRLCLCFGDEIIDKYKSKDVARGIEEFKEGVANMARVKSNLPVGTIVIENTKRISAKDEIKRLADKLFLRSK
ncbi:MAG: hypothetical protein QXL86_00440 [Candidatus Aenigmatarchaeota archaeon]